jgi:hypothetical protein
MLKTNNHSKKMYAVVLGLVVATITSCGDLFREEPEINISSFTVMPEVVAAATAAQPKSIMISYKVEASTGHYDLVWLVALFDAVLETTGSAAETSQFKPPYENRRAEFLAASYSCADNGCLGTEVVAKCDYRFVIPAPGGDQNRSREISCGNSTPIRLAPGKYRWFAVADTAAGKEITLVLAQSRANGVITLE